MKRLHFLSMLAGAVAAAAAWKRWWSPSARSTSQKTVEDRVQQFGSVVRKRLAPHFAKAGITYPPRTLTLVGCKNKQVLQVYAGDHADRPAFIRSYPILRASGNLGPKLKEGDLQVPEGIYKIELLNPNSRYHLSLRIGYPNAFDREQARKEGRTNLGGDIMIHGSDRSVGCLAMGDEVAEDLFILAADTGIENISVILTPVDFRRETLPSAMSPLEWMKPVYEEIRRRLAALPLPN